MTIELRLSGRSPEAAREQAADLLREISGAMPEVEQRREDAPRRLDPATALGIATLVLSLPGIALAGLQIRELIGRRRLVDRVETLRRHLEASDTEAELGLDDGTHIDLRRAPTDRIVDILTTGA